MPLCMEYYIVQMSAAASHSGTDPSAPNFNGSAAKILLNLSDGIGYVNFKGIGRLWLIGIDLDFRKPHKKNSSGVKSHDLGGQFTSPLREITIS